MLQGLSLIGADLGAPGAGGFQAVDPATGAALDPVFHGAYPAEVDRAVELARRRPRPSRPRAARAGRPCCGPWPTAWSGPRPSWCRG